MAGLKVNGPKAREIAIEGMSSDLAYFLGLWVAEGSFEEAIGRITITCGDAEIGEFLTSGKLHGLQFKAMSGRSDQWLLNSYEFLELMRYLKMPLVKAPQKWIPDWVWGGKREWAMEFIAGMFDGDGCVHNGRNAITYVSASERLIDDLQLLLTNIGIVARKTRSVVPPTKRVRVESVTYCLALYGDDVRKFSENIKLRIFRKQKSLVEQAGVNFSRRDGIPHQKQNLQAFVKDLRKVGIMDKHGDVVGATRSSDISYHRLNELLEKYAELDGESVLYGQFKKYLHDNYFWDRVTSVVDGKCHTYDFTIPETHSFWSNGFISHNTPRGFQQLYDLYLMGQQPEKYPAWRSWQFPTSTSPFIPLQELEDARRDMDVKSFEQEFNASFQTMSGRVYYAFDRFKHVGRYPFNPALPIWVGQDFNVDPMTSVILQPQPNGHIWAVGELYLINSNTLETCEELEKRFWRYQKQITIYPDPASGNRSSPRGESDLDIFREKGFKRLRFRRKHPLVADRVSAVNAQFLSASGDTRLWVDESCQHLIASLEQTLYKPGTREVDKSAGVEHIADALGYAVELERPLRKIIIAGASL